MNDDSKPAGQRGYATLSRRGFLGVAGAGGLVGGTLGVLGPGLGAKLVASSSAEAAEATKPKLGGSLTWCVTSDTTTLDPASGSFGIGNINASALTAQCVYDTLTIMNPHTYVVSPRQLQSLTVDATGATWTLKLHSGITFTDGTPLDASAIKAFWDRIALPATASTLRTTIAGWNYTVADAQTLTLQVPAPLGNVPELLTMNLGAIPSPTAVAKFGKLYGSGVGYVVGAGAFTLTTWVTGNSYTLTKNPNFFMAGQPYLDQIEIQVIANEAVALEAVLSKTVDVGDFSSPDVNTHTLEHEGYPVNSSGVQPQAYGAYFNFAKAPFNDLRIRQALILATNCADVNLKATGGYAEVAGGPGVAWYPKGSPFYDASVKQSTNNLKSAQKLINSYIAEKGPIPSQAMVVPNTSFLIALGTALVQGWTKLEGITITSNVVSTTQAVLLYSQGNFTLAVTLTPGYLWPADAYTALYSTSTANLTHYSNPKMDATLTATRGATTIAQRKTGLNQIAQLLVNDAAYLRIYYQNWFQFYQKTGVGGMPTMPFTQSAWGMPSTLYVS
jgi:peptide/nickel transport system substrate-binding protein